MPKPRLPWQDELAIIDRTMKAISGITDPEELVEVYWTGIGELIAVDDYLALSRRNVDAPFFLITRSSRFTEHVNPWVQRERLPRLSGGLLGEIAYANRPVIIEDLPSRLPPDDPARFYLEGFQSLIALPQYDGGEALNVTVFLFPEGRAMDPSMIPMMHWQAGLFGRGTTNLVLRNQVSAALAALDRELQIVGAIQRSLLPRELPEIEGFELSAYYQTSARAGGDYYDFFPLQGGKWGLFIGDVSGHGTPAAVLMAITHAIAHAQPGTHTPPAALLAYLNNQLASAYTHDGSFVTGFYAVLDPAERTLNYSRAGHNPPRLVRGDKVLSLDGVGSFPLGIVDDQTFEQATVKLESGDLLLFYTDGITEALAPLQAPNPGTMFGTDRLDNLLLNCSGISTDECLNQIRAAVAEFSQHAPPTDDQTLVAIRCV
jgi:sigma-B regulation protein RsbU (phosphoserine phosphatase)